MTGQSPVIVIVRPAFTNGAVPRSVVPMCPYLPTAATTKAQKSPSAKTFMCVLESALCIE